MSVLSRIRRVVLPQAVNAQFPYGITVDAISKANWSEIEPDLNEAELEDLRLLLIFAVAYLRSKGYVYRGTSKTTSEKTIVGTPGLHKCVILAADAGVLTVGA